MEMPLLRVLRARKAKHGFEGVVLTSNFIELGDMLREVQKVEPNIQFELNFNMGANEFKLYTNEDTTAKFITEKYIK